MSDLTRLGKAVAAGWIGSTLGIALIFRLEDFSRGALMMDAMLLLLGIAGSRVMFRQLRSWVARFQPRPSGRRVLIYGAGDGGELLLRELLNNHALGLLPVGFVDDDPQKHGRVIHGVRVLGPLERLGELAGREQADEVVVSTGKLDGERAIQLTQVCQSAGLPCRRMRIALE
jgi:UDP-GlcNAc:undecaprenyl-phosphate GlcNAc-1-phosphate transferase